jgi:predicted nucleic acid-binding protein
MFQTVYVPSSVLTEMADSRAPASVRSWVNSPPEWLRVMAPSDSTSSTFMLDQGEADAISLALELGITTILIDERRGSRVALAQGLAPLPTLALLEKAAAAGLIDLPAVLRKLQGTNIRVPQNLIDAALQRDVRRRANDR